MAPSRVFALWILSVTQTKNDKISLCTQFINYNFRIIYQIVEYGNRMHTFHSYSTIFTHFAIIRIKTNGEELRCPTPSAYVLHMLTNRFLEFVSMLVCRHCHCIIQFLSFFLCFSVSLLSHLSFSCCNILLPSHSLTLSMQSFFWWHCEFST